VAGKPNKPSDWSHTDPWNLSEADPGKRVRAEDGLPHAGLRSELIEDAKRRGLYHPGQAREYDAPELGVMSLDRAINPHQREQK
jgi:hypothetical protein